MTQTVRRRLVRRQVPAGGVRMASPPPMWIQMQAVHVRLELPGGESQSFLIAPGMTASASIDVQTRAPWHPNGWELQRVPIRIRAAVA